MAYEQVQKPSSSFVPVQKKVSELAPSASRVQAKDDTASEQEQMPKVSTPATDANWLMKHPLFKGNQFLQREVAPASESESLESEEEKEQGREEEQETATPHSLPVQAKLTIGEPGDKYEQEADRVASQVVKQINSPEAASSSQGQSIQRKEEPVVGLQPLPSISEIQRMPLPLEVQREAMPEEEDIQAKSILQRREAIAGGDATNDLDTAINSARGSGQSLDAGLQRSMGQAMGADFSGVKVHTDAQSDQLNQSIQAKAFTTGQDVFFRQGAYDPGSRGGQELIAHELTHVVQQNGGAVQRQIDRIATPTVIQRFATTYTPDADDAYTGGKGITARVGAQSGWPGGQIPVGGIPPIINHVGAIKGRYVAGHLMNEEIAGLADNPNLTVLSVKSNNTHKGYESNLKKLGYWADFIERADVSLSKTYGDKAYEHGADYRVEVIAPTPDGTANYQAENLLVSGLKVSIWPIRIHKVTRKEEPWPEMQAYKVTNAIVPNVPSYPAAPGTTQPTQVKPPKTTFKDDNDDWSGYNKVPSASTTRSGRTSVRYQPY